MEIFLNLCLMKRSNNIFVRNKSSPMTFVHVSLVRAVKEIMTTKNIFLTIFFYCYHCFSFVKFIYNFLCAFFRSFNCLLESQINEKKLLINMNNFSVWEEIVSRVMLFCWIKFAQTLQSLAWGQVYFVFSCFLSLKARNLWEGRALWGRKWETS